MEKPTAAAILRHHSIEIDLGDHRTAEQVLAAFIAKGHIEIETTQDLDGE